MNQRVLLYAFLACLPVFACNKKNNHTSPPVETAKNYFTNLADQEPPPPPQTPTKIHGVQPRIQPLSKMSADILWEKATQQQQEQLAYTLIPMNENIKPFKNKEFEFFR